MSLLLLFKENPRFYFGATAHGPNVTGQAVAEVAPVPAPATSHGPGALGPGVAESTQVVMPRAPDPLRTTGIVTAESTTVLLGTSSHQGIGWAAGGGAIAVAMPVTAALRQALVPQVGASTSAIAGSTSHQATGSSAFTEIVIVPAPAAAPRASVPGSVLTHGGVAIAFPAPAFGGSVPGEGTVFGIFFAMPAAGAAPRVYEPVSVATTGTVGVSLPGTSIPRTAPGEAVAASRSIVVPSTPDARSVPSGFSSRFMTVQFSGTGQAPNVPGSAFFGPVVYFFFGASGTHRPRTTGMGLSYVITLAAARVLIDIEELALVEIDIDDGGLDL